MTCDTVRPELKAFLDHELSPVAAWRVRRHLAHCAACAAELDSLRRLHDVLRAADPAPAEAAAPLRRPAEWRWAGAALATAALAVLLVILPTFRQSPRSMSAAVAAALSRVNTWHLHGWKQMGGKRVAWDVWGRRWPYLFYEKVGDDITYDDGTQRLRIYPPDPALNRPTGLVIRTDSERTEFDGGGPSVEDMVSLWDWRQGAGGFAPHPYRQTPTTVGFRLQYPAGVGYGVNANQLYTINRFTWLPKRYELQFNTAAFRRDVEDLSADYDVDLPRSVAAPSIPATFSRVNLAGGNDLGLTVSAKPVDMDKAGNVLVQVSDPLGNASAAPGSPFTLSAGAYNSQPYGVRGNAISPYISMDAHGYQYQAPSGNVLFWFAPLEPAANASVLPTALNLTVSVSINVQVSSTDFIGLTGQPYARPQPETLLTKNFPWTLLLPSLPTVKDIEASPNWHFRWGVYSPTVYADWARSAQYYMNSLAWQSDVFRKVARAQVRQGLLNPDGSLPLNTIYAFDWVMKDYQQYAKEFAAAKHQKRLRSLFWTQRWLAAIEASRPNPNDPLLVGNTLVLAKRYRDAGEWPQAQQTLRHAIHLMQQRPQQWGLELRQAHYALQTRQFPDDANYKGPS